MLCFDDFKVFYKCMKRIYKTVHLQTCLGHNQRPCAHGSRKRYTASSQATGQRSAPSFWFCSVAQATQSSPIVSFAREQDHKSPSFSMASHSLCVYNECTIWTWERVSSHRNDNGLTRQCCWCDTSCLSACLSSAYQVPINNIRYGL